MGTNYTVEPLSGRLTATDINDNLNKIQDALEATLSRLNSANNLIQVDLDMNNNHIYNLPVATEPNEPVRFQQFQDILADIESDLTDAQAAADAAAASATSAAASASSAQQSEIEAEAAAADAQQSEQATQQSEEKAHAWAEEDPNVEVEPGEYSAKHWASEAKDVIVGGVNYKGVWDASTGVFPSPATIGDMYRVSVAGTIGAVTYSVGDSIIYNGSTWDKLDNAGLVTSVAGKVGSVELFPSDITNLDNQYIQEGEYGLGTPVLLDSSDNLNTLTVPGFYRWATSVPLNTATGAGNGSLILTVSANAVTQIISYPESNGLYFRTEVAPGTFSPWRTIFHSGVGGTGSGINADTLDGNDSDFFAPVDAPTFTGNVNLSTGGLNVDGSTGFNINSKVDLSGGTLNKIDFGNRLVLHNNGTYIGLARLTSTGAFSEWFIRFDITDGSSDIPKRGLGITGEIWTPVSRSPGVNYTNNRSYPIGVSANMDVNNNAEIHVDGNLVAKMATAGSASFAALNAIVPPGSVYRVETATLYSVLELA